MPGITLLGLGPGDPFKITREAWDVLSSSNEVWLRTNQHPSVASLPASLRVTSFDHLYENGESFEAVYEAIISEVMSLAQRPSGIVYAVPGDPFVAEATCPEIAKRAGSQGLPLRVVNGISFLEPVFSALGIDPYPRLSLVDAMLLGAAHSPVFPPDAPALIAQIYSTMVAANVKLTLCTMYPDDHPVRLVHAAGTNEQTVENLPLYEMDRSAHIGLMSVLYVPPLESGTSMEALQEIVAHLRAPEGCPWDREQTHSSLRSNLIEETYETLAALDSGNPLKMQEEFGDLLLQIVLHAQIASEEGTFNMTGILKRVHDKIIHRHPHVFAGLEVEGVSGVLQNWEKLKDAERQKDGDEEMGLLESIPISLPALIQAQQYQDRAARVGFDWPEIEGVLEKIVEEINEINAVEDQTELSQEIGDLLFALVNFSRWKGLDAESVLRETNWRFKQRFAYIEKVAAQQGKKPSDMSLDEMEALWQEAKKKKRR